MKDKIKVNKWFFDLWAGFYDYTPIVWWLRRIQNKLVKRVKLSGGSSVLDVGCGTGHMLLQLSRKIKKGRLAGIDLSQRMVKEARKKLRDRKNIEIKQGEVTDIPYEDNAFDYVLSTEAFHHFPQPSKAIDDMKRVLKDDGKLIIVDINFPPLFISNRLFKLEPGFVKMYSKKEFRQLFEKAGLNVLKQERVGLFALATVGSKG